MTAITGAVSPPRLEIQHSSFLQPATCADKPPETEMAPHPALEVSTDGLVCGAGKDVSAERLQYTVWYVILFLHCICVCPHVLLLLLLLLLDQR